MLLARIAALGVLLAGCPNQDSAPSCEISSTTPIEIVVADGAGDVHVLADGGDLALVNAPQGGFITLIAPRVQLPAAIDRCQIQIGAAVRNPTTNIVVGLEQRPIILERDGAWLEPPSPANLSDLANVALCSGEPTADQRLRVEVDVLAPSGQRIISAAVTAVPRCPAGDSYCRNSCAGQN